MNAERSPAAGTCRATAFADAKPELAAPGATQERLEHLREHGFVIVTDFVDSPWIPSLREAGRRVTEACASANGYRTIDCSKGYVHRTGDDEPWAIRGLIHPAFEEPGWIKARNVVGWRGRAGGLLGRHHRGAAARRRHPSQPSECRRGVAVLRRPRPRHRRRPRVPHRPGTVVYTPPGTFHQFINTGDEPVKLYFLYVPGGEAQAILDAEFR